MAVVVNVYNAAPCPLDDQRLTAVAGARQLDCGQVLQLSNVMSEVKHTTCEYVQDQYWPEEFWVRTSEPEARAHTSSDADAARPV